MGGLISGVEGMDDALDADVLGIEEAGSGVFLGHGNGGRERRAAEDAKTRRDNHGRKVAGAGDTDEGDLFPGGETGWVSGILDENAGGSILEINLMPLRVEVGDDAGGFDGKSLSGGRGGEIANGGHGGERRQGRIAIVGDAGRGWLNRDDAAVIEIDAEALHAGESFDFDEGTEGHVAGLREAALDGAPAVLEKDGAGGNGSDFAAHADLVAVEKISRAVEGADGVGRDDAGGRLLDAHAAGGGDPEALGEEGAGGGANYLRNSDQAEAAVDERGIVSGGVSDDDLGFGAGIGDKEVSAAIAVSGGGAQDGGDLDAHAIFGGSGEAGESDGEGLRRVNAGGS